MSFTELLSYVLLVVGFALTPGPNMMLYLTYTFEYGRKAGWATAAGIVSSFVVHITAIVLGLTAILVSMPHTLDILRYCGIAYLIYLAITNVKTVKWKTGEGPVANTGLSTKTFILRVNKICGTNLPEPAGDGITDLAVDAFKNFSVYLSQLI